MATTKTTRQPAQPRSLADVRAAYGSQRPREVVDLYLDAEAVAEAERLEQELRAAAERDALSNAPDEAPAIARQLREVRERAEESRVPFTLVALSHRDWAALLAKHPPTEAELAAAEPGKEPGYSLETLPGELVYRQLQDPAPGSPEEWADFWDNLSDGQVRALWVRAQMAQMGDGSLGKSVALSEALRSFGGS